MRELLKETAEDTLVLLRHESLNAKLYFSCDEVNKRGVHHMIKCASFYDMKLDKLIACELDISDCVGSNQKTAEAIDKRIRKLDPCNPA